MREKIERFAVLIQFVKFKSALSTEDVQKVIHERSPRYEALPGLLEKYYGVQHETGEVYGVYTWDSVAAAFARNWSTRS